MSTGFSQVLGLTTVPVLTATVGGVVAATRPPGPATRSGVQHFAAGLVFAAAATELVPDLVRDHDSFAVAIGFLAGLAVMLTIAHVTAGAEERRNSTGLILLVGTDVFVDGILIGVGSVESTRTAVLLTVALALELAFLGLSVAAAVSQSSGRLKTIATTSVVASAIVVGGAIGSTVFRHASKNTLSVVLAFGVVALLYLVTEELLVEAHQRKDTLPLTAMFFVGFFALLLLSMAT